MKLATQHTILLIVILVGLLMAIPHAHATKYICNGWEYENGSRDNKMVKLIVENNEVQVNGIFYSIAGELLNKFGGVEEVFLTLDWAKMDGFMPIRHYEIILAPCTGDGESLNRWKGEFDKFQSCKKHEMMRIEAPVNIMWQGGMQKTSCEIF